MFGDIIRAGKDPEYRLGLSEAQSAALPAHPAGLTELTEEEIRAMGGGSVLPALIYAAKGVYEVAKVVGNQFTAAVAVTTAYNCVKSNPDTSPQYAPDAGTASDTADAPVQQSADLHEDPGIFRMLEMFEPPVSKGRDRLHDGVQALIRSQTNFPFDPSTVEDRLCPQLFRGLLEIVSRTMTLEAMSHPCKATRGRDGGGPFSELHAALAPAEYRARAGVPHPEPRSHGLHRSLGRRYSRVHAAPVQ